MLTLKEALAMSYLDYVDHLLKKYGPVPANYATDDSCTRFNSSIERVKDGLIVHHINENELKCSLDKFGYTDHSPDKLVYCDMIEHLLLHIKIFYDPALDSDSDEFWSDIDKDVDDPALSNPEGQLVLFKMELKDMIQEINRMYNDNFRYGEPGPFRIPELTTKIVPKYYVYIDLLKYILFITGVGYMDQFTEASGICSSTGEMGTCWEIFHDLADSGTAVDEDSTEIDL